MIMINKCRLIMFINTYLLPVFFFFSSRRRHTRFDCDWSSDVCSSDLLADRWGPVDRGCHHRRQGFVPAGERAHRDRRWRSEEHTSELQSQSNLVCRLLLEKKKKIHTPPALNIISSQILSLRSTRCNSM